MSTRRLLVNLFQVMLLVMGLVAIALLSAITTMHFAIHGAEVQVPALKGMTVADARSQTAGLGLISQSTIATTHRMWRRGTFLRNRRRREP